MTKLDVREFISSNWKKALRECQVPSGALLVLSPDEFAVFVLLSETKELKKAMSLLEEQVKQAVPFYAKYELEIGQKQALCRKYGLPYSSNIFDIENEIINRNLTNCER